MQKRKTDLISIDKMFFFKDDKNMIGPNVLDFLLNK